MPNLSDSDYISRELTLKRTLSIGHSGPDVKKVQEWVNLHGIELNIDGEFGEHTRRAIIKFQYAHGIQESGLVDADTIDCLTLPMRRAIASIRLNNLSPNQMIALYAEQHLHEMPREIGTQNCGPWVRLYMKGNEGRQWSWCAGFVSFIIMQAYANTSTRSPLNYSFSCDELARESLRKNIFICESQIVKNTIEPGMIFLRRKTSSDWVHAGIVMSFELGHVYTIEGNTNNAGRYNGGSVMRKRRSMNNIDLINLELAEVKL
ncbi:MAG: peptidoglycan-binding domain-containing protein [Candidatus Zixiibacteriota bacterium]